MFRAWDRVREDDAERRGRHSHEERGNEFSLTISINHYFIYEKRVRLRHLFPHLFSRAWLERFTLGLGRKGALR
jgi:hypothetical protein